MPGISASAVPFVDARLDSWLSTKKSAAWNLTHNLSRPAPAFGQVVDLVPFVFVARTEFRKAHGSTQSNRSDLAVADAAAKQILAWPKTWPNACSEDAQCFRLARDDEHATSTGCWPGAPNQTAGTRSSCVWGDDATMGLTLPSRLVAASVSPAHKEVRAEIRAWLGMQHSLFAKHLVDPEDGLFFHGADASLSEHSCCKWSRANGWMMTAHVEVLAALSSGGAGTAAPSKEFAAALRIFQSHAAAIARVQSPDGRWHNLLNDSSTWLETSGTAMFTHSMSVGVLNGWLQRAKYEPVLEKAWKGVSAAITTTGQVGGIIGGCGIQANTAAYNHSESSQNGAGYWSSSPGLGSVIRAAVSFSRVQGGKL